jgi:hypothetical protein
VVDEYSFDNRVEHPSHRVKDGAARHDAKRSCEADPGAPPSAGAGMMINPSY